MPLNPAMVASLREHLMTLGTLDPTALVFDMPERTAERLAKDLDDAKLPHGTSDGLPLIFHSFRVTCATLAWSGSRANSTTSTARPRQPST